MPLSRPRLWAAGLTLLLAAGAPAAEKPLLTLGPEVCVTTGEAFNHFESSLAVDPADPRRLVVACNTHNVPDSVDNSRVWTSSTYRSADGGRTWKSNGRVSDDRVGDALVVMGVGGQAFFAGLTDGNRIGLWQSGDLGATWAGPVKSQFQKADYEKMVVDRTNGPNRGRLFVHAKVDKGDLRLLVVKPGTPPPRGGKPEPPKPVIEADVSYATAEAGFADPPLVLSDGTLFLPYRSRNAIKSENGKYAGSAKELFSRNSTDGGKTFSAERSTVRIEEKAGATRGGGGPGAYGVGPFNDKDRIYLVRADRTAGTAKLWLRTSDDAGKTWSADRDVTPAADPDKEVGGPSVPGLAVSPEGVVGVSWLSVRKDGYRSLFMASADGGATWTEPVFLSTVDGGKAKYSARYPNGDYTLIDAAKGNVFHPIWEDSRGDKHSHIYHRSVTVTVR